MSEFPECLKCGACCRHLLDDRGGIVKGLVLTESEKSLFPEDIVSPNIAVGRRKPEHMINYQLNVQVCPFVGEKNECGIYEKRPLVCRAFPFVQSNCSVKCQRTRQLFKKSGLKIDFPIPLIENEADQKRERYVQNRCKRYMRNDSKMWEFDVAKKNWIEK